MPPSRKKTKGKARRAAKDAKAREKNEKEEDLKKKEQDLLEEQMQRLAIDNLLRESVGAVKQCRHGLELEYHQEKRCRELLVAFERGYNTSGHHILGFMLHAGVEAAWGNISVVLGDASMMKDAVSIYVADAVQGILDGNDKAAKIDASFACYFEQLLATRINKKAVHLVDGLRISELQNGDMKTVVEYLRKRIPCSCLDQKYEEVKSITKMGICCNPNCSLPGGKAKRRSMFYCAGCHVACYCSAKCQRVDWPAHKGFCKEFTEVKDNVDIVYEFGKEVKNRFF